MPRESKLQARAKTAAVARWKNKCTTSPDEKENISQGICADIPMDISEEESIEINSSNSDEEKTYKSKFKSRIQLSNMSDLFSLCIEKSEKKNLSVLVYFVLRYFNISFENATVFMKDIGALSAQVSHKWSQIFLENGFEKFSVDGRGGKRCDTFYDIFPEIEAEAKSFSVIQCAKKAASFTALELAQFIDSKYYEIVADEKTESRFIRSVESCRLDLHHWGAKFEPNSNRPYFEGHDRPDVVARRQEFIDHFISNENNYYIVNSGENLSWKLPNPTEATILICHDESTFRSGDVRSKRWIINDSAPFFNKGHGRSIMVSNFLVQHPSGSFFQLNEDEWNSALSEFPLLAEDNGLRYEKYSATAMAYVGFDPYFDNASILLQFRRLCQLLKHKKEFKNNRIEILVDNARTHSAKPFSINDFGKRIGSRCPVSEIEYISSNNEKEVIKCYFDSGPFSGKTKGLFVIAEELGLAISPNINLNDLKTLLGAHPAFNNVSRLEQLVRSFDINIIFTPKYHCELNPIEGLWCNEKAFVRKHSDQTFETMRRLIPLAKDDFSSKNVFLKLFRRFWKTLYAYKEGQSYSDVLQLYFSNLCTGKATSHCRITNSGL